MSALTRDQVLVMPHGHGLDGKPAMLTPAVWRRSFTTRPQLERRAGWFELAVWQPRKTEERFACSVSCGQFSRLGEAESWEDAMSEAEHMLRRILVATREAL